MRTSRQTVIHSMDDLPVILSASDVAAVLGISRAKAYQLFHRLDFPTLKLDKRLLVRYDPKTGKLIRKSVYGKTQKEVRQKLSQIAAEMDSGTFAEPSKMWSRLWSNGLLP